MDAIAEFAPLLTAYFEAYARRDADGCAAAFTSDARLVSQYAPPVQGQAGIASTHLDWFEDGEENKTWGILDAKIDGDTGHCLIWFESDIPAEDGPQRIRGHSLSALVHTAQVGWKIHALSLTVLES